MSIKKSKHLLPDHTDIELLLKNILIYLDFTFFYINCKFVYLLKLYIISTQFIYSYSYN